MTTQFMILTFLVFIAISVPIAWLARIPALKSRATRSQSFRIFLVIGLGLITWLIVYTGELRILASGLAMEYGSISTHELSHELWLQMLAMTSHCFNDKPYVCQIVGVATSPSGTWREAILFLALPYAALSGLIAMNLTWRFTRPTDKRKRDASDKAKVDYNSAI